MDASLKENKPNTRKKKILRKRSVVEFDIPLEEMVDVEEVNHEIEMDVDDDVACGVSQHRTKTLSSATTTSKK